MKLVDIQFLTDDESPIALLLGMLDDNTQNWREMQDDFSVEELQWRPVPGAHNIGALLLHIIEDEAYWVQEILSGEPLSEELKACLLADEVDQWKGIWPTPPPHPVAWYYAQHDDVREKTRQIIGEYTDPVAQFGDEKKKFTLRWFLYHVIVHEAYHCGQIALLSAQFKARK